MPLRQDYENVSGSESIIIALMFKPKSEVNDFFRDIDSLQIKWGNYLKEIYFSKSLSETTVSVDMKYRMPQFIEDKNTISSNKLLEVKCKAKSKLISG
ncbi:MAG: hypothetical protein AB1611_05315 [bacterium]